MANNQKHEFALFVPKLNISTNLLIISDDSLYHRIVRVLRLVIDDEIILFDKANSSKFSIEQITKKEIHLKLLKVSKITHIKPNITICISLLKREAFEEALYSCVELGANVIQPIITEKSQSKKLAEKDYERFEKILISAAEQSKNFNVSQLNNPLSLQEYLQSRSNLNNSRLFFDANGDSLDNVLRQIDFSQDLILLIGPEGDLTEIEKELLKSNNFVFCKLTPTILRAQTAVVLALGAFRSLSPTS